MLRLNQLQFVDESRAGFVLAWAFMVGSVLTQPLFGSAIGLQFFGISDTPFASGIFQLASLLLLTLLFGFFHSIHIKKDLKINPLDKTDYQLALEASKVALKVVNRPVDFFVTSNILDANAFCIGGFKSDRIVLGGGLRLLLRKDPEAARSVVAHECAHIRQKDTIFMLITWYTFLAFGLLTMVHFFAAQYQFWSKFMALASIYQSQGMGLFQAIGLNIRPIFLNGTAGLLSIIGLAPTLVYLIKTREYRADEIAAQAGFRKALREVLNRGKHKSRRGLRKALAAFHPTVKDRLEKITNEWNWAKLDWLFCGSLAFLIVRVDSITPSPSSAEEGFSNPTDAMSAVVDRFLAEPLMPTLHFALGLLVGFVLANHFYRVAATQYKLGKTIEQRLLLVAKGFLGMFIGAFIGNITSLEELMGIDESWTFFTSLDVAIGAAWRISIIPSWIGLSMVLLVGFGMRHFHKIMALRLLALAISLSFVLFFVQFSANLIFYGLFYKGFGWEYPRFALTWLPQSTSQIYSGLPNVIQAIGTVLFLSSILYCYAHVRKYLGYDNKNIPLEVHPERLVRD